MLLGIFIGFILPQLTTQFLGFHQGFSLYNVGFTAGIIGMVVLGFMNAFGIEVETRTLTSTQKSIDFVSTAHRILCDFDSDKFLFTFQKERKISF